MSDLQNPNAMPPINKILLAVLILLPLIGVGVYALFSGKEAKSRFPVVDWGMYGQLDLNTSRPSPALAAVDGQKVRSPGFMVPLEDNRSEVMEFLLVPSPQACIHAPPPPSNQMVYVRMVGAPAKTLFGPVMVEGTLRLTPQTHQYGTASFQIYGENVELYDGR
jgi:hypothetical protein